MDNRTSEGLVGCPADLGGCRPAFPHGRLDSHRETLSSASLLPAPPGRSDPTANYENEKIQASASNEYFPLVL